MSEQPDDRTLNACLARVVGKEIWWSGGPRCAYLFEDSDGNSVEWNPLHNAIQVELVEAWLVENKIHIVYVWAGELHYFDLLPTQVIQKPYRSCDTDKKHAFALAVWEMEQSQKGTT